MLRPQVISRLILGRRRPFPRNHRKQQDAEIGLHLGTRFRWLSNVNNTTFWFLIPMVLTKSSEQWECDPRPRQAFYQRVGQ